MKFAYINIRQSALALLILLMGGMALPAATITTNEAELDAIFSQASFGPNPIDIRFTPAVVISDADLLTIDDAPELISLFSQSPSVAPTVNMFFVNGIEWCGFHDHGIIGCAVVGGNDMVVEAGFAASPLGAELIAHELAHNLGLDHVESTVGGNLLNPIINGDTTLWNASTAPAGGTDQISTLLASPLLQSDSSGWFVEITPVSVTATPEPGGMVALLGLTVSGLIARRRRSRR